ncbi:MAG: tRNA (guanosine(46)-N7)-methyltransferase TrmB [Omnitrophica bacterium GWA2_52_12]|nr:MAG: tRNA (guanosine(46)-N7)-methyltransferase TrmB [Omnitrophica bacterium GWA2_52_12]
MSQHHEGIVAAGTEMPPVKKARPVRVFAPRFPVFPFPEFLAGDRPFEMEIGCGKGRFIMARAERHPEINFLALDIASKWLKIGQERAVKKGLANLKFLPAEAREILRDHIPAGRVSQFHIYFPDPWPKRKHQRRRVLSEEVLRMLYERLAPAGRVLISTDFSGYFEAIQEAVRNCGVSWKVAMKKNERFAAADEPMTNYETKYFKAGRDLYYMELKR